MKKQIKIDKICGNCKNFCNQKGNTIYTRGAGYCQINFDAWEKEKNQLKDDEATTKTIPQIFNYFKCSNNKFQEK